MKVSQKIGVYFKGFVLVFLLSFLVSCTSEKIPVKPPSGYKFIVTEEKVKDFSVVSLKSSAESAKLLNVYVDQSKLKYPVDCYKVVYKTTYKGKPQKASGLLFVPKTDTPSATLVFNHGTIARHKSAPSVNINGLVTQFFGVVAATGFMVLVPDYLGYGVSEDVTHPYFIREAAVLNIKDMLDASVEFAKEKAIKINKNLYLSGYSEGGYVGMCLHHYLETSPLPSFDFKASLLGAGGYDMILFRDYFLGRVTYPQPYYMAFIANGYTSYYDFDKRFYAQFFKAPYAAKMPNLIDGIRSGNQINSELTLQVRDLMTDAFVKNPEADDLKFLSDKFRTNSIPIIELKKKMFLYHGSEDITVPYHTSVKMRENFIKKGTASHLVTLTDLKGNHIGAFYPYVDKVISELIKLESK